MNKTKHPSSGRRLLHDLLIPLAIMAPLGTFFWTIRGVGGWGGMMGGAFAGLGWAACWMIVSRDRERRGSRPFSNGWSIAAIMLGITIGGAHGYGQFNSWIKGTFHLDDMSSIAINPWWGWLALLQCGLAWGMTPGVLMSWANQDHRTTVKEWLIRFAFLGAGIGIALLLFYGVPRLTLPFYEDGLYATMVENGQLERTFNTARSAIVYLGGISGLFAEILCRKQWQNIGVTMILTLGFGLSFMIGGLWTLQPSFPPQFIVLNLLGQGGWLTWSMTIGFFGGASFAVVHFLFNTPGKRDPDRVPLKVETILGENFVLGFGLFLQFYNGLFGEKGLGPKWFPITPSLDEWTRTFHERIHLGIESIVFVAAGVLLLIFIISIINQVKEDRDQKPSTWRDPVLKGIVVLQVMFVIGFLAWIDLRYGPPSPHSYFVMILFGLIALASFNAIILPNLKCNSNGEKLGKNIEDGIHPKTR